MLAKDVMTKTLVTVKPETHVRDVANLMLDKRISAVPVMDEDGTLLGIVSEGDLMRRSESGTERYPSWWLTLLSNPQDRAFDYIKAHGVQAADVMTRDVVTVDETAELREIADILERNHIKRVPVLSGGKPVGIVSRADLLRGFAMKPDAGHADLKSDRELREAVEQAISESGADVNMIRVIVSDGIVALWGAANSETQKRAILMAAESVAGAKSIDDKLGVLPKGVRPVLFAE